MNHGKNSGMMQEKRYLAEEEEEIVVEAEDTKDVKYLGGLLTFKTEIVWSSTMFIVFLHASGLYGAWLATVQMWNYQFATPVYMYIVGWYAGLFGISMGAHRLWSHRSFKATTPLKIFLIIANTIAGQNACYYWVRDHRLHHKYSDTNADPHNVNRGFFFSHVGWLMMKKHRLVTEKGRGIDMTDLENDAVVQFQRRHFMKMFFTLGILLPVSVPYFVWGETFKNSLLICFSFRYMLLLNITWTINSVAHMFGNRPYDRDIKPAQNGLVSFFAYGEGWHNYHHSFPWDYKSSEFGMHLNVGKVVIEFFASLGLAYDLRQASEEIVNKRAQRTGDGTHRLH